MKKRVLHSTTLILVLVGLISIPFWINKVKVKQNQKESLSLENRKISKKQSNRFSDIYQEKSKKNEFESVKKQENLQSIILEKKQKQAKFSDFLRNHPYSNRPHLTKQEWKKYPKKDRPDLAMEQDFLRTLDPNTGTVPWEAKQIAYEQTYASLNSKSAIPMNWVERGPNNIGGRTRAIMFDPNDATDKKVWAGGVHGGLWYNNDITNANASWQHIDSFWDNIAIASITYDPSNTQIFYVGTGEGYYNGDHARGNGIWKTTDGGTNWTQLSSTNNNSNFRYINDLEVTSTGVVIAGTRSGVYRSTNGGSSWSKVHNDNVMDLEKSQNGDLYLGDRSGQIHKSTDEGATWSADIAPAGGVRVEIACAPSDNNTLYAIASGSGSNDVAWFRKSTNGGSSWTSINIPSYFGGGHFTRGQAWFDLILAVHPNNPDLVLAGGVDLHRTTDGGSTWTELTRWYFDPSYVYYAHADQHGILFRPNHPNEAIFSNDGGLSISTTVGDPTATPKTAGLVFETRVKDYNVTQFYACAVKNVAGESYYLAGSQDNGTHKFESVGINATTEVTGGDGAYCFIDQDNSNYQISSYVYNNYYRSTNDGISFSTISSDNSGSFINPTEYDSESDILYSNRSNSSQIKRISGISSSISSQNIDLGITMSDPDVTHLKASPYTSNRLFLGVADGSIYRVDNANATPSTIEISTTPLPTASISCIEVGQNDEHLLVTFSNYNTISVWETTDGGSNWTNKEGNLPNMPVRWALYNPDNYNQVLLATEFGVWSTDDFSNASVVWGASNAGLANVRCTMLKYRSTDKQVVVATHGRGLFTSDVFSGAKTYFETSSINITETTEGMSDCVAYKDYTFEMKISSNPVGSSVMANIEAGSGTATNNEDFEILTAMPLTFTTTGVTSLPFTIRVYDDVIVEDLESIEFTYTLDIGTSNTIKGSTNQTLTLNISDNDNNPGAFSVNLLNEDWSSGSFTSNEWLVDGANIGVSTDNAFFYWEPSVSNYEQTITSKVFDANNINNILMSYDFTLDNYESTFECQFAVEYKKTSESTWTILENFSNTVISGDNSETYNRSNESLAVDNSEFQIRFRFYGESSFAIDGMYIDNITIVGDTKNEVANTIVSVTEYLGANQTIHFYNGMEIIATIENFSNHEYGCTTVEIDATGTGAKVFYNNENSGLVTDKTFKVTPTNPNSSGSYNITLYYKENELEGWETATGNSRDRLSILKSPESITNQTLSGSMYGINVNRGSYLNDNFSVTAQFDTGFSGFAGCISGTSGPMGSESVGLDNLFKVIKIYPNPATDNVHFETEQNIERLEAKMLDLQGKRLLNFVGSLDGLEKSINTQLSSLQTGVYIIYIKIENKEGYLKLVKQ